MTTVVRMMLASTSGWSIVRVVSEKVRAISQILILILGHSTMNLWRLEIGISKRFFIHIAARMTYGHTLALNKAMRRFEATRNCSLNVEFLVQISPLDHLVLLFQVFLNDFRRGSMENSLNSDSWFLVARVFSVKGGD